MFELPTNEIRIKLTMEIEHPDGRTRKLTVPNLRVADNIVFWPPSPNGLGRSTSAAIPTRSDWEVKKEVPAEYVFPRFERQAIPSEGREFMDVRIFGLLAPDPEDDAGSYYVIEEPYDIPEANQT